MYILFYILFFLSLIAFIIGMIKPELVVFWTKENKTRKNVGLVLGFCVFIFLILGNATQPPPSEEDLEKEAEKLMQQQKVDKKLIYDKKAREQITKELNKRVTNSEE